MKKLLLLFLLPVSAWATNRTISINAPSSAISGQTVTVPVSASTDATDSEQIGFFHAEYSTDGGASWTALCYDANVGKSATRTAVITAGGMGSTIVVRVRIAFRGGAAGDVASDGSAIDWSGTWTAWATPVPTRYSSINVEASPNGEPTAGDLNEGLRVTLDPSTGAFHLAWWGRAGRTYFIQSSEDLQGWTYFSEIRTGANAVIPYGFTTAAARLFFRLRSIDQTATDPMSADFDDDGLTNAQEFAAGTDPLNSDTEGDGIPDGWEVAHGFDPRNGADANADRDGDGLTNLQEYQHGTNVDVPDNPVFSLVIFSPVS